MNFKFKRVVAAVLFFMVLIFKYSFAETSPYLSIKNEFLKVILNNGIEDKGRFSIETTQGNPTNEKDDYQLLIYGRPIPWTSYTSVLIDGKPYVFGGKSSKQEKRSSRVYGYGVVRRQLQEPEKLVTEVSFGAIEVTQELSFFRNPNSKVKDSVLVTYVIINKGTTSKKVGLRMLFDTKLGSNDAASFRMGKDAYNSEILFRKAGMYPFWQVFDDLVSPNIVSQGTLFYKGDDISVDAPDRLYLASWGGLFKHVWDFPYKKGRSFVFEQEEDADTALAMYWEPKTINPGETIYIRTIYGLGGVSVSPGSLSLGLTAPLEIFSNTKEPIFLMGYLYNSGGYKSMNTRAFFHIPKRFKVLEGMSVMNIGELAPGEIRQLPIKLEMNSGEEIGEEQITFAAESTTFEENKIVRSIQILSPPTLKTDLRVGYVYEGKHEYLSVKLKFANFTNKDIRNIRAKLFIEESLVLPVYESLKKDIFLLPKDEIASVGWIVKQSKDFDKVKKIKVIVESDLVKQQVVEAEVSPLPKLPLIKVSTSADTLYANEFFYLSLMGGGIEDTVNTIYIVYDVQDIEYFRFSKPYAHIVKDIDTYIEVDANLGVIKVNVSSLNKDYLLRSFVLLASIHFKALYSVEDSKVEIYFNSMEGSPAFTKSLKINSPRDFMAPSLEKLR